jgi:hypothetical protein
MDKPSSALGALSGDAVVPSEPGVSGLLWVHLLAGRGLRSTASSSAATTPSTPSGPPIGKWFSVNVKGFLRKSTAVQTVGTLYFMILKDYIV